MKLKRWVSYWITPIVMVVNVGAIIPPGVIDEQNQLELLRNSSKNEPITSTPKMELNSTAALILLEKEINRTSEEYGAAHDNKSDLDGLNSTTIHKLYIAQHYYPLFVPSSLSTPLFRTPILHSYINNIRKRSVDPSSGHVPPSFRKFPSSEGLSEQEALKELEKTKRNSQTSEEVSNRFIFPSIAVTSDMSTVIITYKSFRAIWNSLTSKFSVTTKTILVPGWTFG